MPKDAAISPVTFDRIQEGVVKEEGIERRRKGRGETKMKIVTRIVRRPREKVGTESWYESRGEEIGRKGESGSGTERYKGASFVSLTAGM